MESDNEDDDSVSVLNLVLLYANVNYRKCDDNTKAAGLTLRI